MSSEDCEGPWIPSRFRPPAFPPPPRWSSARRRRCDGCLREHPNRQQDRHIGVRSPVHRRWWPSDRRMGGVQHRGRTRADENRQRGRSEAAGRSRYRRRSREGLNALDHRRHAWLRCWRSDHRGLSDHRPPISSHTPFVYLPRGARSPLGCCGPDRAHWRSRQCWGFRGRHPWRSAVLAADMPNHVGMWPPWQRSPATIDSSVSWAGSASLYSRDHPVPGRSRDNEPIACGRRADLDGTETTPSRRDRPDLASDLAGKAGVARHGPYDCGLCLASPLQRLEGPRVAVAARLRME